MNNWTAEELAFRCERLSMRLERLARNFLQMSLLCLNEVNEQATEGASGSNAMSCVNAEAVLALVRENKVFLELTALDLDVESAFELAQMQRQLSRWHIHWIEIWTSYSGRLEISTRAQTWANRVREMAGVLV